MLERTFAALLAVALAAGMASLPRTVSAEEKLPVPEIERIVRDYLLREPEVIYQAIQELQQRQRADEAKRQQAVIASSGEAIFRHAADPVAGDRDARVTLVEFFDYRCGYCRSMSAGLRQLMDRDQDLRFVFKELPVLGPDSLVAAKAALAANRLDPRRYRDFHLALMQSKDLSRDAILAIAARQGYDTEALSREMEAAWVTAHIDETKALADKLGISGTPSFVMGDTLIPGAVEIGDLASRIEAQRKQVE